jgi:hypothetical protein
MDDQMGFSLHAHQAGLYERRFCSNGGTKQIPQMPVQRCRNGARDPIWQAGERKGWDRLAVIA